MMDDLSQHIAAIVQACIDRGMRVPFIMWSASPNGCVLSTRFTPGSEMEVLAEYFPEEGFLLPINVMIVDQEGEAARVTITADGATTWH